MWITTYYLIIIDCTYWFIHVLYGHVQARNTVLNETNSDAIYPLTQDDGWACLCSGDGGSTFIAFMVLPRDVQGTEYGSAD